MSEYYTFIKFRMAVKKDKKEQGFCGMCGKRKCEQWCRGPILYQWLLLVLKTKFKALRSIYKLYRMELHWAGTEPWHRYE